MVLAELGQSLTTAIGNLTKAQELDEPTINALLNSITKALMASDVDFPLVVQVQKGIKAKIAEYNKENPNANPQLMKRVVQQAVVNELFKLMDCGVEPYQPKKGKTNVIMFVGLQGSGKTTTVTKFAHYYQRKGWKTGLVCADTYRAGAFDQLKQNATKARIPFYGSYTEVDPVVVCEAGVNKFRKEKFDLIIIDTSGRHKQENALFEEMQEVARVSKPDDIVFVMDGSIGKSAKDQALAFRSAVDVGSVVITKLDGHAKGGGALSAVAATKAPIIFIGTGEHITDIEKFNTKSFVQRLLGMGDIGGLVELVQDSDIMDTSQKLVTKLTTDGKFTLRDLSDQFRNIMKLGPLSQIMGMLPNMGLTMNQGQEKDTVNNMKKFLTILDSMNPKELDGDGKVFEKQPTRIQRVADGSGTDDEAVRGVLAAYSGMEKMMGGFGGIAKMAGMGGPGGPGNGGKPPNPADMQKMLSSMGMDPKQLQQMQNQMKGNPAMRPGGMPPGAMPGAGAGGMPDLGGMMNQMMGMFGGAGGGNPMAGLGGPGGPGAGAPGGNPLAGMDLGGMMNQMMGMFGGAGGMPPGMPPGMGGMPPQQPRGGRR